MIKLQPFIFAAIALVATTTGLTVKAFPQPEFLKSDISRTAYQAISPKSAFLSAEQIDYFLEVAMGSEFPASNGVVRKWQGEIRIQVQGTPTLEDMNTVRSVIKEINFLAEGSIYLRVDEHNPNMKIYFVPEEEFAEYESNYQPVNYGFFWTYWNNNQVITRGNILISTEDVTQKERSHLIREELTQSLGLMRDSSRYENSIFYQGWTDVNEYSQIDKVLIQTLYRPQIQPGMSREQVRQVLMGLLPAQNPQQRLTYPGMK
ncbi:DUF2927 domain-containing protein [Ancylothrix sp. C2]|uniref:DUF2927 domain-containing protein n=1 Tax=Ancylothrix sp. D3o TaxID=2953691 RepID=UPI0021BAE9D1|nr:DUF2927 domain-containing protein [Ancylothrix sp. D3o]MCT7952826.1 DUF2927 domain-containing protein [Ancylothrix sp. D3o]